MKRRLFSRRTRGPARNAGASAGAALLLALVAAGCNRATVLGPSPADALREENLALREQIDQLTRKNRELEATLAQRRPAPAPGTGATQGSAAISGAATSAGTAASTATGFSAGELDAATPKVASVQIDGASEVFFVDETQEAPLALRLWVAPRDGRGRFLQMVGRLTVSVTCVRAGSDPVQIAEAKFDPLQIRNAWRSGFMGTHYAFEVPLAVPAELRSTPLTVTIRFDDAQTGLSFEDQRRLAPPSRSQAPATERRS